MENRWYATTKEIWPKDDASRKCGALTCPVVIPQMLSTNMPYPTRVGLKDSPSVRSGQQDGVSAWEGAIGFCQKGKQGGRVPRAEGTWVREEGGSSLKRGVTLNGWFTERPFWGSVFCLSQKRQRDNEDSWFCSVGRLGSTNKFPVFFLALLFSLSLTHVTSFCNYCFPYGSNQIRVLPPGNQRKQTSVLTFRDEDQLPGRNKPGAHSSLHCHSLGPRWMSREIIFGRGFHNMKFY